MDSAHERTGSVAIGQSSAFKLEQLKKEYVEQATEIIHQNLDPFEDAGSILAASFRRLEHFYETYSEKGCAYFVVIDSKTDKLVGGAGVGPLASLPYSEKICEIREIVIEKNYRRRGLGARLLQKCLAFAEECKYKRIYLETTSQMDGAQRLFERFGFRPIEPKNQTSGEKTLACYYMLEPAKSTLTKTN